MRVAYLSLFLCCLAASSLAVPLVSNDTALESATEKVVVSTEKPTAEEVTYTLIASSSSSKVPSAATVSTEAPPAAAVEETSTKPTRTRPTRASRSTTSRSTPSKTTRSTKRRTSTTTAAPTEKPESKTAPEEMPMTRQEWLKLIESEMIAYEKKQGGSPISNKNLTMISNRILKYLIENGTAVGLTLKENKANNVIVLTRGEKNVTAGDKIYGDGTEAKFPPILEYIVQRIQQRFSIYKHEDQSRLPTTEENATLRETPDDDDDDDDEDDSKETSTLSNEEVFSQIEEELAEYLDPSGNGTVKLPTLIKTAYDKFTSWLIPSKGVAAKEEPVEESSEDDSEAEATELKPDGTKKKPSIIKTAYEAIETLWSIFDESEGEEDDDKTEKAEGPEQKETPEDESAEDKDSVSDGVLDFLNMAYTLYESS